MKNDDIKYIIDGIKKNVNGIIEYNNGIIVIHIDKYNYSFDLFRIVGTYPYNKKELLYFIINELKNEILSLYFRDVFYE